MDDQVIIYNASRMSEELIIESIKFDVRTHGLAGLPVFPAQLTIPLGALLMLAVVLGKFFRDISTLRKK